MSQPDACIVRITDAQGNTLGTGFLVSTDGRIATCAHVVEGTEPHVAFPGGEPRPAQVLATDPIHDVAILKLEGELPPRAEPARLGRSVEGHYSDFRSRGYRPLGEMQGIPAEGRVQHAVSECPGTEYMPLILKSQDIRKGMSGAPVYVPDLDLVVGMITGYWDSLKAETGFRDAETGFAVPSEAIIALCHDIQIHEPSPRFSRPPFGVPFQAPAVPRYFVPRPEASNELKARLMADEPTAPGALVVSAVHGLGGIGKTTLVAALAHDRELQARFPDGILWVTLGQEPDVLSLLVSWIQAMGDYDFRPTIIESASNHLQTLLHGKACLLVVDDAWQSDHIRHFLVGGERCRVLVTTRDATLARKVGARLHNLDVMTEGQALALFEARLGPLDGNRERATALARELGYLPLALELVAAQVESGLSWSHLLEIFCQALADLSTLDLDEATYRNESLRLSFHLSLERLSPEDQDAFAWLGVLPEDARLNPRMAATLWEQSEADAYRRLHRLRDKALLKSVGNEQYMVHDLLRDEAGLRLTERMSLPEAHATLLDHYRALTQNDLWYTLPDDGYIHQYLAWHMEQSEQLDAVHNLLREETLERSHGWYRARDMLAQTAGFADDIRKAWRLAEGEFDVLESKRMIGLQCRYALMIASLGSLSGNIPPTLLSALVDNKVLTPAQGLAYARQVPYRPQMVEAMASVARFLSGAVQSESLLMAFNASQGILNDHWRMRVVTGLVTWLPQPLSSDLLLPGILNFARCAEDASHRASMLASLLPCVPLPNRQQIQGEVLSAIEEASQEGRTTIVGETSILADALAKVGPYLSEVELQQALAITWGSRSSTDRARCLVALLPYLEKMGHPLIFVDILTKARELPQTGIFVSSPRCDVLRAILPYLVEDNKSDVLRDALSAALAAAQQSGLGSSFLASFGRFSGDVRSLANLAPYLPEALFHEALQGARTLQGERNQVLALSVLVSYAPEMLRNTLLHEVLARAHSIGDQHDRDSALRALVSRLAALDDSEMLFSATLAIEKESDRATAIADLAPFLPEPMLQQALSAARQIQNTVERSRALAGIATALPEQLKSRVAQEALSALHEIEDKYARGRAMVELAPAMARLGVCDSLLKAITEHRSTFTRTQAISAVAPYLPVELLPTALATTRLIWDQEERVRTLVEFAVNLSALPIEELLATIKELEDDESQVSVLVELASRVPQGLLREVLSGVNAIKTESERAKALAGLAPYLPEHLALEALSVVEEISTPSARATAIGGLASHLPEQPRTRVSETTLTEALEIRDPYSRVMAILALEPHVSEQSRDNALKCALATVEGIENWYYKQKAQIEIGCRLGKLGYTRQASHLILKIKDKIPRAEALARLASELKEPATTPMAKKAMKTAAHKEESLPDDHSYLGRAQTLIRIASYVPEPLRSEALETALEIVASKPMNLRPDGSDQGVWQTTLMMLAVGLAEAGYISDALAVVPAITQGDYRASTLGKIGPHLSEAQVDKLMETARSDGDQWTMAGLAPWLVRLVDIKDALAALCALGRTWYKGEGLHGLAPHLTKLPVPTLRPLWYDMLPNLARGTRADLLVHLRALLPVILALGGQEAIAETFRAIQDVGLWWP